MRYIGPISSTRGQRRELRQRLRNGLGTSSDRAPSLGKLIVCVVLLDQLMRKTTGNVYGVAIHAGTDPAAIPGPDELQEAARAWQEG